MLRFEILEVICLDGILGFSRCCNELRLWEMLGWGAYILHVNGQESSEARGIITLLGWKIPPQRCDMLLLLLSRFSRVRLYVTPWRQPTRLPRPWDSPGKNTGVGCHFLLQCVKVKSLSPVRLLATPQTAAYQAPPSMGFSRQEYWSGVPLSSPKMWHNPILIHRT